MRQRVRASGNATGIAVGLLVFLAGLISCAAFGAIGVVIGVGLCLCALFMGGKRVVIWTCQDCGYYYETDLRPPSSVGCSAAVALAVLTGGVVAVGWLSAQWLKDADRSDQPRPQPVPAERPVGAIYEAALVGSVRIDRVRLEEWRNPETAQVMLMAYVDWTNVGNRPIHAVCADIVPTNEKGREHKSSTYDYCIFYSDNGVLPGESYREPEGEGFVLGRAYDVEDFVKRATAKVTRAAAQIK